MCRSRKICGRVLFEDTQKEEIKRRIDDWYATDLGNSLTSSISTLSNIVIDESESNLDGSPSSSNSFIEQRIVEIEPTLSTLTQK
ncbi:hypothetical protein SASPL_129524 [Salvia splendens]|uniref:Uncharacterized protein n=1 Tax=Salvia splendens TaxID=180675 RepID=A0A8X8XEK7_SALSN|nr:hypothetical protein SASPL_129524 [Salvia splendens]